MLKAVNETCDVGPGDDESFGNIALGEPVRASQVLDEHEDVQLCGRQAECAVVSLEMASEQCERSGNVVERCLAHSFLLWRKPEFMVNGHSSPQMFCS